MLNRFPKMAVKSSCLVILYILGILQLITEGREQTQPGQTDVGLPTIGLLLLSPLFFGLPGSCSTGSQCIVVVLSWKSNHFFKEILEKLSI